MKIRPFNAIAVSTSYAYFRKNRKATLVALADFNGDGKGDIFLYKTISGQTYGQAYLGIGNGAGGFTFNAIANVPNSFDHVSTWVANGASQHADLLLYSSSSGLGWVGLGTSTGFNFTANAWSAGFTSALILDFNGDGIPDMLLYNKNNASGYLLEGPSYASAGSVFFGSGFDNVVAADLNSDGLSDVVLYRSSDGAAYTGLSTGNISGGIANFTFTNLGWPAGQMLAVDPYPIREQGETEPVCVSNSGGCTAPTGGQLPLLATNVVQSGQGAPPYFMLTAQFTNSSGVSQINGGQILINVDTTTPAAALNGCIVMWYPITAFGQTYHQLQIWDATPSTLTIGPGAGTLSDNACGVSGSASYVTSNSSSYTVTLALYFQPGFSGPHSIYLSGLNTAGLVSPWVEMGMISVLPPSSMPAITLVTPQYETILPSATNTQIPAAFLNYNSNTNPVTLSAAPVSDSSGNTITTTFQQSTTSSPTTANVSVPAGTAAGVYNVQVTATDTVTGASTTRTMAVTVAGAHYVVYVFSTGDPTYLDTLPGNVVCRHASGAFALFSVPDPYLGVGYDWFISAPLGSPGGEYQIVCDGVPTFYAQVISPEPPEIDGVANMGEPLRAMCCGTAAVDTSGRLRLVGSWLTAGGSTPNPQIDSDDPNISLSLYHAQDTFALVSYTVGPNATIGNHTITLTTDAGSAFGFYTVGDATPVITGITPNSFAAGDTVPGVVITGSHIGTVCPSVVFSGTGTNPAAGNTTFAPNVCTDSLINGTVKVDPNADPYAPAAAVSLSGNGYGQGFIPQSGGSAQSNPVAVSITGPSGRCGSVQITSRPITFSNISPDNGLPYYATLTAVGSPAGGTYTWSTNSSYVSFDHPQSQTVQARVSNSGKATITVTYTTPCGTVQDSLTFVLTDDITVVGWIDGPNIAIPSGADPHLVNWLYDTGFGGHCDVTVASWAAAGLAGPLGFLLTEIEVTSDTDRRYANAYLNANSGNAQPPQSIPDPAGQWSVNSGDFRAYNRFRTYYEVFPQGISWQPQNVIEKLVINGPTPDPCKSIPAALSQTGVHNDRRAIASTGGSPFQVAEARVGAVGQQVNAYLNHKSLAGPFSYSAATPWIWSSIQFDASGNLQTILPGTNIQIFPTYYVYRNGQLVYQFNQMSNLQQFIALIATSLFMVP